MKFVMGLDLGYIAVARSRKPSVTEGDRHLGIRTGVSPANLWNPSRSPKRPTNAAPRGMTAGRRGRSS